MDLDLALSILWIAGYNKCGAESKAIVGTTESLYIHLVSVAPQIHAVPLTPEMRYLGQRISPSSCSSLRGMK